MFEFKKGTKLNVGNLVVTLEGDVPVSFFRSDSPSVTNAETGEVTDVAANAFAGLVASSGFDSNFELNIGQLKPHIYNVHGVYQGEEEAPAPAAPAAAEPESEPPSGKLPDDFPGHAALADAGITTFAQARKQRDSSEGLKGVPGVGDATAAKIEELI